MLSQKEAQELALLNILRDDPHPLGSVSISILLRDSGLNISAATVGRLLSEMDFHGFTAKYGFKGRVVTDTGVQRLEELRLRKELDAVSSKFFEAVDSDSKDNLIDVLTARRGIEREIVRLAAMRANEADVEKLRRVNESQIEAARKGMLSPEHDVTFHRAIAKASKNKVLAAAYDFIWQYGKLSPVMEYIRKSVGGMVALDHGKIVDAIAQGDSEGAEMAMTAHIESLIDDVEKYWSKAVLVR